MLVIVVVIVLCVTVTVTTYTPVTFHTGRVRSILQVRGPHFKKSITRDHFFGELRSTTLTRKAKPLLLVFYN
jgi:hypothetical protein